MSESHLKVLSDAAMQSEFAPDERIFRKGDLANRFYLIQEGRVSLGVGMNGDGGVVTQDLGPGDVLGWSWLFEPYLWNFDAVALEPTKAIFLYATRLREACDEDPALGYELMKRIAKVVIDRLQATRGKLLAIASKDG